MSTAYEARWSGSVNTSDDPYSATSSFSSSELGFPVRKHVQNVVFLPSRNGPMDNLEIKKAIMNYGAVANAMYFDPTILLVITKTHTLFTIAEQHLLTMQ
jgi:C1A family cysteine protease